MGSPAPGAQWPRTPSAVMASDASTTLRLQWRVHGEQEHRQADHHLGRHLGHVRHEFACQHTAAQQPEHWRDIRPFRPLLRAGWVCLQHMVSDLRWADHLCDLASATGPSGELPATARWLHHRMELRGERRLAVSVALRGVQPDPSRNDRAPTVLDRLILGSRYAGRRKVLAAER